MRGPDFIIIGAMKGGTSTLQAQLAAQEGIFMTTPKEPNYFSDTPIFERGPDWYGALFAAARPGDLTGEASTHYTKLPTWPETVARMQAALPAPRLIYLIRNPLDRALSHYLHAWSEALVGNDVEEAFAQRPELVDYGCYGRQIAPFVEAFGSEAILLTSLEEMQAAPQRLLDRIGHHIGHIGPLVWQETLEAQNVSAKRFRTIPFQGLLLDNPVAETLRRTLVPKALRTRIRETRQPKGRPTLPKALREDLEAIFLADRQALAKLFPGHPALDLCYPFVPTGETV